MIAVSPTRPNFLFVMPPVDVAAAKWPLRSQATAPTVPIGRVEGTLPAGLVSAFPAPLLCVSAVK